MNLQLIYITHEALRARFSTKDNSRPSISLIGLFEKALIVDVDIVARSSNWCIYDIFV